MPTSRPPTARAGAGPGPDLGFADHLRGSFATLVGQLHAITLDPVFARDLVLNAYAWAWPRWSSIAAQADPVARIRSEAIRVGRRRGVLAMGRSRNPEPAEPADPDDRALLGALARLGWRERACLVLHDGCGLPVAVLAAPRRAAASAVQGQLAHARTVLLDLMSDPGGTGVGDVARLRAMKDWDRRKTVAIRDLVGRLAEQVRVPDAAEVMRHAGRHRHATRAAAVAVATIGALGLVTATIQPGGPPEAPPQVVAPPPSAAPVPTQRAAPAAVPTRRPAARPRVTRPPATSAPVTSGTDTGPPSAQPAPVPSAQP